MLYLGGVLGVAALAAPWIYLLAQRLAEAWPVCEVLAHHPFRRYVSRCLMVLALAGLWPLLRSLRIRNWTDLGLDRSRPVARETGAGFTVGVGLFLGLLLLSVFLDLREFSPVKSPGRVVGLLAGGVVSAGAVGILEEILFRGALYGMVRRVHGWWLAMGFSTVIYAVSHFLARVHWEGAIGWAAGFGVLGRSLRALLEVRGFLPEFLVLLAAGFVLAQARERSGSLWLPIGLHAGWVMGRKLADGFTEMVDPGAAFAESLLSVMMLVLTAVWVQWRHRTVLLRETPGDAHDEPGESLA
ncbi:MAG: CPBP family intramembrane metalloprotease [Verrucomicrobiae bacterium]|nr:CPBP family intramembrane metalloprotease [Verrucomicrobiae bacterium]